MAQTQKTVYPEGDLEQGKNTPDSQGISDQVISADQLDGPVEENNTATIVDASANVPTNLLIVEDHKITLEGLKHVLSADSQICISGCAESFQEGIEMAIALKPDVILLDLHLPDSPGPRTMIRQFAAAGQHKIVVFSGEEREIFVEAVLASGANTYVFKSEPATAIAQAIKQSGIQRTSQNSPAVCKDKPNKPRLSEGEKQILGCLARGLKYQDIADTRFTTIATVRKQCERLLEKLQLETREQLIAWAVEHGFAGVDEE